MGYRATREGDILTIHRVPIFCACSRGDTEFDDVWIKTAVAKAMQQQRESYMPPLHIRHHEPSTDANNSVRAAGYFRVLGAEPITLKGARRTAILADLIITDPTVQGEVLAMRLPYRSVEIFDVANPGIDGLALLDHEAPFLELPMLMVSDVDDRSQVAGATFAQDWTMDAHQTDSPVVACFRQGAAAHMLFREDPNMTTTTATPETKPETFGDGVTEKTINFADDEAPKKDKDEGGEDMEGDKLDVSSIVKAIGDGSISIADMDAILAAIQGQKTEAEPEVEEPAPAAVPGAEAMKKDSTNMTAQMAALQGQNEALAARLDQRDAADTRRDAVAAAMTRLSGRALGSDLEERLIAFHKGAKGDETLFTAYVDAMATNAQSAQTAARPRSSQGRAARCRRWR
jgi:hypothetical protein